MKVEKEKILHLLQLGVPKTIIAKNTGISRTTLYKYIRKMEGHTMSTNERKSVDCDDKNINSNEQSSIFSEEDYDNILNKKRS